MRSFEKKEEKNNKILKQKIAFVIAGVTVMSFGISLMRFAVLGIDPISCMNTGVARKIGMSFGNWQLIMNAIMLVGVFFSDRRKIGFGTVYNMAATGYTSDAFLWLLNLAPFESAVPFPARAAALVFGILILYFGAAFYIEANMGVSPYDALAIIFAEKIGKPHWFRWARIGTDILCVGGGFLTKSDVGLGTLITACFAGPLLAFFRNIAAKFAFSPPFSQKEKENERL
jgi:uncharacterized membrane protein YczE